MQAHLSLRPAGHREEKTLRPTTPRTVLRRGTRVLVAVATLASLTLLGAGAATAQGSPQHSGTVNVGATISGSGIDPTIECSWALTDDNLAGGGETQQYSEAVGANIGPSTPSLSYTDLTQPVQGNGWSGKGPKAPSFGGSPNSGQSFQYGLDDDPSLYPTPPPCDLNGSTPPAVTMAAGSQSAPTPTDVSVLPNAFDNPAPRRVEFWAATDGATSVTFNVFYPDGKEDAEAGGVETTNCQTYGTSGSLLTDMFTAAGPQPTGANELSAAAIHNASGTGIVDLCNEGQKDLWDQALTISKDDPNGTYTVETIASNVTGGQSVGWFSFVVIPFFLLSIDFNNLKFTNNGANVYQLAGDTTWAPPASNAPTVTNGGNSGEQIGIAFSKLSNNPSSGSPVFISQFDANIGYNTSDVLTAPIRGIAASNTPTYLGSTGANTTASGPQLVCPNDASKLDLSADPPSGAPAGNYTGSMEVWARSEIITGSGNGGCTTDNGAPYIVSANGTATFKQLTDKDQWPLVRS
jgi:hypothetical protein